MHVVVVVARDFYFLPAIIILHGWCFCILGERVLSLKFDGWVGFGDDLMMLCCCFLVGLR